MKITKAQLKQIIKEEILQLEMFDTGSAGEEAGGTSLVQKKAECEKAGGKWVSEDSTGKYGYCSKNPLESQKGTGPWRAGTLEEEIDENIAPPLITPDYDEVDHETYRTKLRGKMAPFSQEELQALLPNERIADPMNPSTFNQPETFIPLGKTDLFVYFKASDGPILRMAIGDKV